MKHWTHSETMRLMFFTLCHSLETPIGSHTQALQALGISRLTDCELDFVEAIQMVSDYMYSVAGIHGYLADEQHRALSNEFIPIVNEHDPMRYTVNDVEEVLPF